MVGCSTYEVPVQNARKCVAEDHPAVAFEKGRERTLRISAGGEFSPGCLDLNAKDVIRAELTIKSRNRWVQDT